MKMQKGRPLNKPLVIKDSNASIRAEDSDKVLNGRVEKHKSLKSGLVCISGMSPDIKKEDIVEVLTRFGKVINVRTLKSRRHPKKTFAFVEFEGPKDAEFAAKAVNNFLGKSSHRPPKAIYVLQNDPKREEILWKYWYSIHVTIMKIRKSLQVPKQNVDLRFLSNYWKANGDIDHMEGIELESKEIDDSDINGDPPQNMTEAVERIFKEIADTLSLIVKKFEEDPTEPELLMKRLEDIQTILELLEDIIKYLDEVEPNYSESDLNKLEFVLKELQKILKEWD